MNAKNEQPRKSVQKNNGGVAVENVFELAVDSADEGEE
jgi:hypothetical protein